MVWYSQNIQDDRDRLIRVEEGLKAVNQRIDGLERSLNQRIDGLDKRIDGLQNLLYVVIAAIFAQIVGVVGLFSWTGELRLHLPLAGQKRLP